MKASADQSLINYLGGFISDSKKMAIEKVLANRTRYITVVLEDIYQPHNASAVIRSCDCFGIQDLHVIENSNEYTLNPNVAQGSSKWVNILRYRDPDSTNTEKCLTWLGQQGYSLYATSPHGSDMDVDEIKFDHKMAFLFGTELNGLSGLAKRRARQVVRIPMYGFTESFNLSVSVALFLQTMVKKMHLSGIDWHLSEHEKQEIRLMWYRKSVRNAEIIEKTFLHGK
jgi:tRNA (guanosine-2'-O-)-methyltransferase